ncbi:MAG: hypothetical protein M3362_05110 [Acidobacteriota bacterium]|nr:hypothetical protein [Acidobacteriota bacterium]
MKKIQALIIDDEPLAREGIRLQLRPALGVQVIGECGNGPDAVPAIRKLSPDLVQQRPTAVVLELPREGGNRVKGGVRFSSVFGSPKFASLINHMSRQPSTSKLWA